MAAPVRGTNGRSVAGEPIAADPAAEEAADAAERATSSVLALDGWGRLEPESHANGSAPPEAESEAAPDPDESAEAEVEAVPEATVVEPLAPDLEVEPSELSGDRGAVEGLAGLRPIGFDAAPGLRLLGPALIFGLAVGAIVGAALRLFELRNAPPPAPPPSDPAARLRRRLATLQDERAAEIAELRRRLHALGVGEAPAPPAEPTLSERIRGLW